MAVVTIAMTEDTVIEVATSSGGSYSPISDLDNYSYNSDSPFKTFPVFQAAAHSVNDPEVGKLTLSGFKSIGDSGQDMLRAAKAARSVVYVKLLADGTNGFYRPFKVGTIQESATRDGNIVKVSFELSSDGDEVAVP